jgi:3-oxoacyl-[acyl-carrier-protein] synthase II
MEKKSYFVNGVGVISPQYTFDNTVFLPQPQEYENTILKCVVPDFKAYIQPVQLRRLSRLLRIGLSAAITCLRDAKDEAPTGIITSTGYGFLDDTAKFLTELLQQDEKQLTPTHFMQSTYNALGGLVASHIQCTGYNTTYVSKGFAFETALCDALMRLNEDASQHFLVGSYDEADATQFAVNSKAGYYRAEPTNNLKLFERPAAGSLQGEGAAFFFISAHKTEQTWCSIKDTRMMYAPGEEELTSALIDFLLVNLLSAEDVDIFINGASGDVDHDGIINRIGERFFTKSEQLRFKHLCGEYCTASSFALWMGASVLKKQQIPGIARMNCVPEKASLKNVLIVNQYGGRDYTFILLERG